MANLCSFLLMAALVLHYNFILLIFPIRQKMSLLKRENNSLKKEVLNHYKFILDSYQNFFEAMLIESLLKINIGPYARGLFPSHSNFHQFLGFC